MIANVFPSEEDIVDLEGKILASVLPICQPVKPSASSVGESANLSMGIGSESRCTSALL